MFLLEEWKYFSCTLLEWKMAIHMLFLQASFKGNGNTFLHNFLVHFFYWMEMAMCFLNTSSKGNDGTLISRDVAMIFLHASLKGSSNISSFLFHTYFKGKSKLNPFLALFIQEKWQYMYFFSCTLLSTVFKRNGSTYTFLAHLLQGK